MHDFCIQMHIDQYEILVYKLYVSVCMCVRGVGVGVCVFLGET